ncbi:hypothetical protein K493DRAFT_68916 [Basidiobolus meristosporus CBS 931.73]|uniref:F-box domain-containing protein n=1 Tax=Basidiobolus meristosporus CBS 931.73 TaxID=1314790 RepID=A0A1Y1Z130_9FUNG|nr:hypothetical protein K493DRAFT_68916 [Basidiobolus meristosporus CBS 931.73]|eukprot:ORY03525.1 hypothetical protein K493DRAFT_68916 [Basidiobolus meristosporus CBS 931.73]
MSRRIKTSKGKEDNILTLPSELRIKILGYLSPHQLAQLGILSRAWQHYVNVKLNVLWWNWCMEYFWESSSRPKAMGKADQRKDWRLLYLEAHLGKELGSVARPIRKSNENRPGLAKPWQHIKEPSIEVPAEAVPLSHHSNHNKVKPWSLNGRNKIEMREYYKSIRSKPKWKKPNHDSSRLDFLWDD